MRVKGRRSALTGADIGWCWLVEPGIRCDGLPIHGTYQLSPRRTGWYWNVICDSRKGGGTFNPKNCSVVRRVVAGRPASSRIRWKCIWVSASDGRISLVFPRNVGQGLDLGLGLCDRASETIGSMRVTFCSVSRCSIGNHDSKGNWKRGAQVQGGPAAARRK